MSSVLRMFNLPNPGNGMPEEFFFLLLEMGLGIGNGLTPATLNRLVQKKVIKSFIPFLRLLS